MAVMRGCRIPAVQDRPARERGFTMMELLVAVSIAAVLFAIGVPMYRNASLGARLSAAANNLLASVQLARSEAIKRNVQVTLCASSDGATCAASGGWEQGWIVVDAVADPDVVIQRQQNLPAGYKLTQSGGSAPLVFQPIGIGMGAATFTACRNDPLGAQERVLTVRAAGTAQVTSTEAGVCP
jgi:type IV fimbrial biogenesis protein FimT